MEQTKVLSQGQVATGAADVYERFFVPALFAQWPPHVAEAAAVKRGDRVLDVACGTGVLARHVATNVVGPAGSVVGLDRNSGMLAVAERTAPQIEWRHGQAEALPFGDNAFDAAVCQFGLMFFDDRVQALREMRRVVRSGGRVAAAVWDTYANSPGFAILITLLAQLFGEAVAEELRQPFVLGDTQELQQMFAEAGVPDAEISTEVGTARFASLESWIYTQIRGWTLAETLDDDAQRRLLAASTEVMQPYVSASGTVEFPIPAHIVSAAVR